MKEALRRSKLDDLMRKLDDLILPQQLEPLVQEIGSGDEVELDDDGEDEQAQEEQQQQQDEEEQEEDDDDDEDEDGEFDDAPAPPMQCEFCEYCEIFCELHEVIHVDTVLCMQTWRLRRAVALWRERVLGPTVAAWASFHGGRGELAAP